MNCKEAIELAEEAIDKDLPSAVKRRLDLHLSRCESCRRLFEAERAEHVRWFRIFNDPAAMRRLPPGFADRLAATAHVDRTSFWFRIPRWLKRVACFAVLLSGAAFAATVVVDAVTDNDGEGEGTVGRVDPNAPQATEGTGGSAASAAPAEVVSDVPYVPDVASVPSTDPDNQQPANIHQPEGETKMTIKQKTVAALAAAATYCVALVSSANAEVYTWTGSASGVWNKTDANWDKGVWVDGNIASFPDGVSAKDITLGADVTASGVRIASGGWSLGGAHTLTLQASGSGNVTISQTSSASLTLKNGVTVLAASPFENNINLLNIENATLATSSGKRFHNGWNGGSELAGGATINVRDGGTLSVYEFVPSPSQNAANAGIYRINVATGGVFQLDHVLQTYNIDTTRYGTLYFDGGTFEGFPGASGRQFDRLSKTQIRLGPGGMHIAGDDNIYIRTEIVSDTGTDGGIFVDTTKMVYFYAGNTGLPENKFNGPVRCTEMGCLLIVNGDRNFGAVPDAPMDGIIFDSRYGRLLAAGHDTRLDPNRNILIQSNAVVVLAASACSLDVAGTISGNAPGSRRNGTLNTDSPWTGELSLLPPAGRTNSIGRLIVKTHDLTIGGEGVTEITDTLDSIGHTGDDGVFSVMSATLNVTNGLVRVMTNNYSIVENGNLNVSGGMLDLSRQLLFANANNGTSTTTVSRTGTLIVNQYCPSLRQSVPELGLTRLQTGGTFMLNSFYMPIADGKLTARAQIDFDGGVLAPQTPSRSFFDNDSRVSSKEWITNTLCMVREGGVVISNDVEIWTHHPFLSGAAQDGGLHKWGTEKLAIITTENTFNGPIEVHQGQLVWGNDNNYFPTARLITHDGGIADINSKAQTLARVEGDGVVKQCNNLTVTGAVAPGFGVGRPGRLTFQNRCTFNGCALEIDAGDTLCLSENQDISGLTLNVADISAFDTDAPRGTYKILDAPNGYTGTLAIGNLSSSWYVRYSDAAAYLTYKKGMMLIIQ